MVVFLFVFTFLSLFNQIKIAKCDNCNYYPNYPTLSPAYATMYCSNQVFFYHISSNSINIAPKYFSSVCTTGLLKKTQCSGSYTCCEQAASTAYESCCLSNSSSISSSFWWITLTVIGLIFLVIAGTLIAKLICYKKNKHLRLVGATNNNTGLFRISGNQIPNYNINIYNTNDSQLPSYNLLPHPLFERVNTEPPKYDEFIKSQQQQNIV